ncbi:hypothetical protein [Burkholderia sp. Bp8986]|uniref:hypothetical protein n=1 Tax=Burkholderia sp. Bp8986 TaxID=2184550 RepID=UPI000F5B3989|nr:hypothetical protein [Burkholderia sp. Bp8986]RQS60388.1 hypothetical protein DID99_01710 [Burkholderia sp. Bp8986]
MITLHYKHYQPQVLFGIVVDDFGLVRSLPEDFGLSQAYYMAWDFALDGGAIPEVSEGALH